VALDNGPFGKILESQGRAASGQMLFLASMRSSRTLQLHETEVAKYSQRITLMKSLKGSFLPGLRRLDFCSFPAHLQASRRKEIWEAGPMAGGLGAFEEVALRRIIGPGREGIGEPVRGAQMGFDVHGHILNDIRDLEADGCVSRDHP
jgi:hypothetical protein